jgi:hypothetical protein
MLRYYLYELQRVTLQYEMTLLCSGMLFSPLRKLHLVCESRAETHTHTPRIMYSVISTLRSFIKQPYIQTVLLGATSYCIAFDLSPS